MTIHRLFTIKDVPIVLMVLLAFLSWGAKHIVDRVSSTPIIEYRMNWIDNNEYAKWKIKYKTEVLQCGTREPLDDTKYNYLNIKITNLSNKLLLNNLSIAFGLPPDASAEFKGTQLLSKAPALKGDNVESCSNNYVQLDKLQFHPGWEYTLMIAIKGKADPYALLLQSDKATIFEEGSLKTCIVRHEIKIILILLLLGIVFSIWYVVELSKSTNDSSGS